MSYSPKNQRLYKYGLTDKLFKWLWDEQNGLCAICQDVLVDKGHGVHVDHDHKTGYVRGLLCASCNRGLGHFKESADVMLSAVKYLEESGAMGQFLVDSEDELLPD